MKHSGKQMIRAPCWDACAMALLANSIDSSGVAGNLMLASAIRNGFTRFPRDYVRQLALSGRSFRQADRQTALEARGGVFLDQPLLHSLVDQRDGGRHFGLGRGRVLGDAGPQIADGVAQTRAGAAIPFSTLLGLARSLERGKMVRHKLYIVSDGTDPD